MTSENDENECTPEGAPTDEIVRSLGRTAVRGSVIIQHDDPSGTNGTVTTL